MWSKLAQKTLQNGIRHSSAAPTPGGRDGIKLWRNLTFFVAFPSIGLGLANVYLDPEEHDRPEFVPCEYLRIRTKRFPWGDGNHSFFHHPYYNALPDGYETDEKPH